MTQPSIFFHLESRVNQLENPALKKYFTDMMQRSDKKISEILTTFKDIQSLEGQLESFKKQSLTKKNIESFRSHFKLTFSVSDEELAYSICRAAKQILVTRVFPETNDEMVLFLKKVADDINLEDFKEAYENLIFLCKNPQRIVGTKIQDFVLKRIYSLFHYLIPNLKKEQLQDKKALPVYNQRKLQDALSSLLNVSSKYPHQQKVLAIDLAKVHIHFQETLPALHYYTRALLIAEKYQYATLPIHKAASQLLMRFIFGRLIKKWEEELESAKCAGDATKFQRVLEHVSKLEKYCYSPEEEKEFKIIYKKARDLLNDIDYNKWGMEAFQFINITGGLFSSKQIEIKELDNNNKFITQKYRDALREYREEFEREFKLVLESFWQSSDCQTVRKFQETRSEALKDKVIAKVLEDSFEFMNFSYEFCDLRAMGSFCRQEMLPYSDLEWMVLFPSEKEKEIASPFIEFIELQVFSLGETASSLPAFTCIGSKNASGLHLDGDIRHTGLMDIPEGIALFQSNRDKKDEKTCQVNDPENLLLASRSMQLKSNPKIFERYEEVVGKQLPEIRRRQRAVQRIEQRLQYFRDDWTQSIDHLEEINIKKQFTELLNHLIGDLALFFNIKSGNTLDVLDDLIDKKIFHSTSLQIFKEAVAAIYIIRARLHIQYGEQKETARIRELNYAKNNNNHAVEFSERLREKEIDALNRAYWLVLYPLYTYLSKYEEVKTLGKNSEIGQILLNEQAIDFLNVFIENRNALTDGAIQTLVQYLVSTKSSLDTHFDYYSKLSNNQREGSIVIESFRKTYIKTLHSLVPTFCLERFYQHPTLKGIRQQEFKLGKDFLKSLEPLLAASAERGKYHFAVKVQFSVQGNKENPLSVYLKTDAIDSLFDPQGNLVQDIDGSSSLYFVQQPRIGDSHFNPGYAQAAYRLMMRLFGHGAVFNELLKITVEHAQPSKPQPPFYALVFHRPQGVKLDKATPQDLKKIDPKKLTNLFLSAPFLLSGNFHEENILLFKTMNEKGEESTELSLINNSLSWMQPVIAGQFSSSIQFYNVLFFKFPNFILDKGAIKAFLSLEPKYVFDEWLVDLHVWNFKQKDNSVLCRFPRSFGSLLLAQFARLQSFLEKNQDNEILAFEILKNILTIEKGHVKEIGSVLYDKYSIEKRNPDTPSLKTDKITGRKGTKKGTIVPIGKETEFLDPKEIAEKEIRQQNSYAQVSPQIHDKPGSKFEIGFEANADPKLQESILNSLLREEFQRLNLSHCAVLNNSTLEKILKKSKDKLIFLDVSYCKNITEDCLLFIQAHCQSLEELHLNGCKLNKFLKPQEVSIFTKIFKVGQRKPALSFAKLKILGMKDYATFDLLDIAAPLMEIFNGQPIKNHLSPNALKNEKPVDSNQIVPKKKKRANSFVGPIPPSFQVVSSQEGILEQTANVKDAEGQLLRIFEHLLHEVKKSDPEILKKIESFKQKSDDINQRIEFIRFLLASTLQRIPNQAFSKKELSPQKREDLVAKFYEYLSGDNYFPQKEAPIEEEARTDVLLTKLQLFEADKYNFSIPREEVNQEKQLPLPSPIESVSLGKLLIEKELDEDEKIAEILRIIKKSKPKIETMKGKNLICLIGPTGGGKSTTFNWALGSEMYEEEDYIKAKKNFSSIGHGRESETFIPEGVPINDEIILCDMPGYLDNRSVELNIVNAVNIRNLFANAKSSKILLIDSYNNIRGRALVFAESIETLVQSFSSKEVLERNTGSFLIGINRVPGKVSFDKVRDQIIEIAEKKGWNLESFRENIIPIDPLEQSSAPKRKDLLERLQNLNPLENSLELFKTALSSKDKELIRAITKKILEKVDQCWMARNIAGILDEYSQLVSLRCIEHPSILESLEELRSKIWKYIEKIEGDIRSIAHEDIPQKRVDTLILMRRLETCCSLDVIFDIGSNNNNTEKKVSTKFKLLQEDLKKIEERMQEMANKQIQENFASLIHALRMELQKKLKNGREQLLSLDLQSTDILSLLKDRNIKGIDNLQYLFSEIDSEIKLRPQKYYYSNDILSEIKKSQEEEIISLIKEIQNKALREKLDSMYQALFLEAKGIVAQEYSGLVGISYQLDPLKTLNSLTEYGFNASNIQICIRTLTILRRMQSSDLPLCEERLCTFLGKIHEEALFHFLQNRLTNSFSKEKCEQLNQYSEELSRLNPKAFQKICTIAQEELFEKPQRQVMAILEAQLMPFTQVEDTYSKEVKDIFEKLESMQRLPACFPNTEAAAKIFKEAKLNLKNKEAARLEKETSQYEEALLRSFTEAKSNLKALCRKDLNKVYSLVFTPEQVEESLGTLSAYVASLRQFRQYWTSLHQLIDKESLHYVLIRNTGLSALRDTYLKEITNFFKIVLFYSKLLMAEKELKKTFAELHIEADRLIKDSKKEILNLSISESSSGFSEASVKKYNNSTSSAMSFIVKIEELMMLNPKSRESHNDVLEACSEIEKEMRAFPIELRKKVSKRNTGNIMEQLRKAIITKTFLSITELSKMLDVLEREYPNGHEEILKGFKDCVKDWSGSPELRAILLKRLLPK